MKKLIALVVMIFSISAFAKQTVNFSYFGNENGNRYFYACDYVEGQTEYFLELFGATNIEVYCSGGIQPFGSYFPVSVRATFNSPLITGNGSEEIEVEGDTWNPACGLNVTIVKNLLPKFKGVEVLKKRDSCAFASTNFFYKFKISK